jgi:hypothetical protein
MSQTPESTLLRAAGGDALKHGIAQRLRDKARDLTQAGERQGLQGEVAAKIEALNGLAELVAARPATDPRTYACWLLRGAVGDTDTYEPGEAQSHFIAALGSGISGIEKRIPPADTSFNELVALLVEETLAQLTESITTLRRERDEATQSIKSATDAKEKAEEESAELVRLREQAEADAGEIAELNRDVRELHAMLGPEAERRSAEPPRRTKVEGHVGIYRGRDGEIYEVGVSDDTGKTRWVIVGPDLGEALAVHAELTGKTNTEIQARRAELAEGAMVTL